MSQFRRRSSPLRSVVAVAALLLAVMATACATQGQVRQIIDDANAASISGDVGMQPAASGGDWRKAVAAIEAFIQSHPDQPDLTNPLRVREALVLCVHQQDNLAKAAFEQVDAQHLAATPRERALYEARSVLPWWFKHSTSNISDPASFQTGRVAMKTLAEAVKGLPAISDTRDYLTEMRARIALQLAHHLDDRPRAAEVLVEGMEGFAETIGETELRSATTAETRPAADVEALPTMRRKLNAPWILAQYRHWDQVLAAGGVRPAWKPAWVASVLTP
jgi:hypothetical protein